MSEVIQDTDYLYLSTRIKALENSLLTRERMERMLDARSDDDAAKVLQECGYPEVNAARPEALDEVLSKAREDIFSDLGESAPDKRYLDIFKLKYDYHNVKVFLKAEAKGVEPDGMLQDMGTIPASELREDIQNGDYSSLPAQLGASIAEAREVLSTTGDPQLCDIALDRGCYAQMMSVAEATGSAFLIGYVRLVVDAINLRTLVRTLRMGKNAEFLKGVLFEGGEVPESAVLTVSMNAGNGMEELYAMTVLKEAAAAGYNSLSGGSLTQFEKLCDDAVGSYLAGARFVAFGEAPLVGYLAARETEFTNIRIIMMGRMSGLDADTIRERLREAYV